MIRRWALCCAVMFAWLALTQPSAFAGSPSTTITRPGAVELDVTNVYDVLAELVLLANRLPQSLTQLDTIVDQLVEHHQVIIVDGENRGDPVAAAATMGYWLDIARAAAGQAAQSMEHAQQTLTWAAAANPTHRLGK